jgi:hypothetical protein
MGFRPGSPIVGIRCNDSDAIEPTSSEPERVGRKPEPQFINDFNPQCFPVEVIGDMGCEVLYHLPGCRS